MNGFRWQTHDACKTLSCFWNIRRCPVSVTHKLGHLVWLEKMKGLRGRLHSTWFCR
jgi:hypothetical protein